MYKICHNFVKCFDIEFADKLNKVSFILEF